MKVPSGFFTSTFKAPGRAPSSGATDCAIHSCGSSKLTVFAGSEKVFQAEAVATGAAVAVSVAPGVAPPEAVADAGAVVAAVVPGPSGCAVHPGPLFDGVEHPARSAPARSTDTPDRALDLAMPSMQPA